MLRSQGHIIDGESWDHLVRHITKLQLLILFDNCEFVPQDNEEVKCSSIFFNLFLS